MEKSLLLVGVGGQGTILVSKIISEGLLNNGYDVKMSEIHGMAQEVEVLQPKLNLGKRFTLHL